MQNVCIATARILLQTATATLYPLPLHSIVSNVMYNIDIRILDGFTSEKQSVYKQRNGIKLAYSFRQDAIDPGFAIAWITRIYSHYGQCKANPWRQLILCMRFW